MPEHLLAPETPDLAGVRCPAVEGRARVAESYAGYAVGRKGRPLVFAAMANDFDGSSRNMKRRLQEVLAKMVESY